MNLPAETGSLRASTKARSTSTAVRNTATADSAVTGTLLGTVTISSGALTQDTRFGHHYRGRCLWQHQHGDGGWPEHHPSGAVAFTTDAATTAATLCLAINTDGLFDATVSGAVVTVKPHAGAGTTYNGVALATTVTTLTATSSGNLTGGVAAVNSLTFAAPSGGVVSKSALGLQRHCIGHGRMVPPDCQRGPMQVAHRPRDPHGR